MRNAKIGVAGLLALSLTAVSAGMVAAQDDEVVVGVSWNNFQEERWALRDEPAIQAVLDEAGAQYISTDAASSAEKQVSDIEQLINQGADAIIILAQDNEAILPAVEGALAEGIPVIAYDRLFETESEGAYYVTFDNVEVGRMQAQSESGCRSSLAELTRRSGRAVIRERRNVIVPISERARSLDEGDVPRST